MEQGCRGALRLHRAGSHRRARRDDHPRGPPDRDRADAGRGQRGHLDRQPPDPAPAQGRADHPRRRDRVAALRLDRRGHRVSEIAGDVSELVAARDALAQSEERFRSLVQRSADVAFVIDEQGVITYASPAIEHFGYAPDAGRRYAQPRPDPSRRRRALARRDRSTRSRAPGRATVEWRFRNADGSYRWVEEVLTDMQDVARRRRLGRQRPRHHRPQAAPMLERVEAEERFRQGFERSAFGLAVLDLAADVHVGEPRARRAPRAPGGPVARSPPARVPAPGRERDARARASSASCAATRRTTSASTAWCGPTAASSRCWST